MIREWMRLCCMWPVIRRGLKFAVAVGAILIAINHGDALLRGELGTVRLLKMGLTVIVPYVVSVLSSAAALRELDEARRIVSDVAGEGEARTS